MQLNKVLNDTPKLEDQEVVITIDDVTRKFRLYHDKGATLKELLVRLRRGRSYEDFWALRDVSFQVAKGEVLGLIGENGCGKSTLLKCLAKILMPTQGVIRVDGRISALLEVGAGFHQELTGRENIYLNGSILGLSRKEIDRRFDDIVHFAELEQFIDMPVRNYSSGMYVRLGFAVAVNVDPDILLVDEVLAVGDQAFQDKCRDKIDEIRSGGKTIILVSHNLENVKRLCDRVVWLDKGEVVAIGSAEMVIDAYLDNIRSKQEQELGKLNAQAAQLASEALLQADKNRWGSMEATIERVKFLDIEGRERLVFKSGEPLRITIDYKTKRRISKPLFVLFFYRSDGIMSCGTNNEYGHLVLDFIEGEGILEYYVPDLLLLEGSYSLSVAIYDSYGKHPHDYHEKLYHFNVAPGKYVQHAGVFNLPAEWVHSRC